MNSLLLPAQRRDALMARMVPGSVAIFATSHEVLRNADSQFRFRPDSDFYYLTGFNEPDAVLVLLPGHPEHHVVLFVRPRDRAKEVWNGWRAGLEGATTRFGADKAYEIEMLEPALNSLLTGRHTLYYRLGASPGLDTQVIGVLHRLRLAKRRLTVSPCQVIDPTVILHELRLFKGNHELDLLRKAASITAAGFHRAITTTKPDRHEFELQAEIEYEFRRRGGEGPGYGTIVGGGKNATILHYVDNSEILESGALVLVDAGAEYQFYTADVTRTWPVNGRFSSVQRDVYQVVLSAQEQAINACQPGCSFNDVHAVALKALTSGLVDLGILKGNVDTLVETEAFMPYYMHRTSHWLGMDVHDAGDYVHEGSFRKLEPGMVLTVEPGLYFAMDQDSLPEAFRGIGVRIEDDILITDAGHEILTEAIPKSIDELQALVGTAA